jgi:hypothetical protein
MMRKLPQEEVIEGVADTSQESQYDPEVALL